MSNNPESDAGGYHGDWRRGAPMGRPTLSGYRDSRSGEWVELAILPHAPPCTLRKVRLDSGGYDQGGAYWGHSRRSLLYYFEGPISDISGYVRGADREDAKAAVRSIHPHARFFR